MEVLLALDLSEDRLRLLAQDERPRPAGEDEEVIYDMADYALARGAECGDRTTDRTQQRVCVGSARIAGARALLLAEVEKARGAANAAVVADLLDEKGVHPNIKDSSDRSLLILAARNGHAEIVSVLVTAGADVNAADPVFRNFGAAHHAASPLSGANAGGAAGPRALRASVLYYFGGAVDVRNAASGDATFDWNRADANGFRPLDLLAESFSGGAEAADAPLLREMADYLVARGAECGDNTADQSQFICRGTLKALLDEAEKPAGAANLSVFLDLLKNRAADPDYANSDGRPLLIVAARNGHAELVSVLAAVGANVNATDPTFANMNVAHHLAAPLSSPAAGPRALRASVLYHFGGGLDARKGAFGGANFNWNRKDANGRRPPDLLVLAEDESPRLGGENVSVIHQMADYMLVRGANCGATVDKTRRVCAGAPRILSARASLLAEVKKPRDIAKVAEVLRLLDDDSVTPDTEDPDGTPILIVAATLGHAEIVSVLITAGADPEARLFSSICGGSSIGRAAPHLTAQNNFGSALYYSWGTALNVLRHFADAVNQVGAPYDWNADGVDLDCKTEAGALDFLRLRYDDDTSLPGEERIDDKRTVMGRMAAILIENGASCANQANKDHVTCAGPPFTVTVEYGEDPQNRSGGTLTASILSGGTTLYGALLTFTAIPAHGWELSAWQGDASACPSSDLECALAAHNHLRVTALFLPAPRVRYAAETDPPGESGGSVTVAGTDGAANDVKFVYSGGTLTFTAIPADGWELSIWVGDASACPSSDLECAVAATTDVSVGVTFIDIDECATDTDDCAAEADGGFCTNTAGDFTCGCVLGYSAGYSGAQRACFADKTISFLPSPNGTLSAAGAGSSIQNGGTATHGATVTFTAAPAPGYRFSVWFGDCAGDLSCEVVATINVSVGATFMDIDECATNTDNCAADGGFCDNTEGDFTCGCVDGYSGDGRICRSDKTVSFQPPANGTISAAGAGVSIQSGDTAPHGTTVTFTVTPALGYRLSVWFGDCAGDLFCEAIATRDISVGATFMDIDECQTGAHNCTTDGGFCDNTEGDFTCGCVYGYSGNGRVCRLDKTVSFQPPTHGTLSAAGAGVSIQNGDTAPHGTTVTFTVAPAPGYRLSVWFGDCAGVAENDCAVTATMDVSAGAIFIDIDECATSTDDCVAEADGGFCTNTAGDFTCGCVLGYSAGYSGAGRICFADKTVSFLPSPNGTLSAEGADVSFQDGHTATHGTTITFTAAPAPGYRFSVWFGDCAGDLSCEVVATIDVSVGATFIDIDECSTSTDDCAAEADGGFCTNTAGDFTCGCVLGYSAGYSGAGRICFADKTVSLQPSANGTLSAAGAGGSIQNGDTAPHGTTVTFTVAPASGYRLSVWFGDCAGVAENACAVTATMDVSVGVTFIDIDECATDTDDCAAEADGGFCTNTAGDFTCGCVLGYSAGYSGAGRTCFADKTISFLPSPNGTLSAEGADVSFQDGDMATHGATITFTAAPASGYRLSVWFGDCAGDLSCAVVATLDVSVGATFIDIDECQTGAHNCAADGGFCDNTEGDFTCGCVAGYSGNGRICRSDKTVSFQPPANGTLSAAGAGSSIQNGGTATHGTTVTFTVAPAPGYRLSAWFGDCAGVAENACAVTATMDVSAGAIFIDIDECATSTDDCAAEADGGFCTNTAGDFTCGCVLGYSGAGRACFADKTVSFLPSPNGTLSAEGADVSFQDGDMATHGATITFTAAPAPGYRFSVWFGDCAGDLSCEVVATIDVSVGATFIDIDECQTGAHNCAADGGRCINTRGIFNCVCVAGYSGNGRICHTDKAVSFQPPAHGTLSAESAGVPVRNGDTTPHGTTVTFTAAPDAAYQLSMWTGDCAGTFVDASAGSFSCEAVATLDVSVGATFAYTGRCAASGHLLFGAPPDLRCAPPTICPDGYAADNDCLPAAPADAGSNPPRLPDAANEPNACQRVFGGRMRTAGGGQAVCSNVDRNNTFCIVGSRAAFPCRGLFKHVWKCNTHNRPALNPFFCGERCAGGTNMVRGRECGKETLDAPQSADAVVVPQNP